MLELDGGNAAEALIHFERAVMVDSTAHNAWFFQAQCHERLGHPGLALAGYQKFLPCPRIPSLNRRSANASTSCPKRTPKPFRSCRVERSASAHKMAVHKKKKRLRKNRHKKKK